MGPVIWQRLVEVELSEEACQAIALDMHLIKFKWTIPLLSPQTNDFDTALHYSQAMAAPDKKEVRIAMEKKIQETQR